MQRNGKAHKVKVQQDESPTATQGTHATLDTQTKEARQWHEAEGSLWEAFFARITRENEALRLRQELEWRRRVERRREYEWAFAAGPWC